MVASLEMLKPWDLLRQVIEATSLNPTEKDKILTDYFVISSTKITTKLFSLFKNLSTEDLRRLEQSSKSQDPNKVQDLIAELESKIPPDQRNELIYEPYLTTFLDIIEVLKVTATQTDLTKIENVLSNNPGYMALILKMRNEARQSV